jgi:ParB family transcriptional regulator, chromosome partitioning protein
VSKQRRLGRGLDALLQGRDLTQLEQDAASIVAVPLARLRPNPNQPRKTFPEESLHELARSIEERGIIQPILAEQQEDGDYLIVAGERRWRAAGMAGLSAVPVLPGTFTAEEKLEIALIENIQRQDLSPLEEAHAYEELLESTGLSQDELARRLGKSRPALANSLRLLKLPEGVQQLVSERRLSAGHARTLLALADDAGAMVDEIAKLADEEGLSVRSLERLITMLNRGTDLDEALRLLTSVGSSAAGTSGDNLAVSGSPAGSDGNDPGADGSSGDGDTGKAGSGSPGGDTAGERAARKTVEMARIEQQFIEQLGTRVVVTGTNQRGRIEISYLSMDDLERIAEIVLGEGAIS